MTARNRGNLAPSDLRFAVGWPNRDGRSTVYLRAGKITVGYVERRGSSTFAALAAGGRELSVHTAKVDAANAVIAEHKATS